MPSTPTTNLSLLQMENLLWHFPGLGFSLPLYHHEALDNLEAWNRHLLPSNLNARRGLRHQSSDSRSLNHHR